MVATRYYFSALFVITVIFISCTKEGVTTRRAVRHQHRLESLAGDLFARFDKEEFFVPQDLDTLNFLQPHKHFLKKRLKCPYIHIIYNGNGARFLEADSVVIFTRTGFPLGGKQHNIVVDMKKVKRETLETQRKYLECRKIAEGIFYIKHFMPDPF